MEGKGVRAMIMGILILGLLVAQMVQAAKFCCEDKAGLNCFNDCCPSQANLFSRTNAPPQSIVCSARCKCPQTAVHMSCPPTHPHEITVELYCHSSSLRDDTIATNQNSDVHEGEENEANTALDSA